MLSAIVQGAVSPVRWSFPLAAASALLYRFPIPLAGYQSGASAIIPSLVAAGIYGLLGVFPLMAALGGAAGWFARSRVPDEKGVIYPIQLISFVIAAIGVTIMANLDYVIGPW
ncbi:MAG: hypothetical protein SGJ19_02565 [Planctomycetia bacterium]|nr:hypothetical protein [Planctomycetia bacterium]